MKRIVSIVIYLLLFFMVTTSNVNAASSDDMSKINEFLVNLDMPSDVIESLDNETKKYIYETTDSSEKLTFNSYDKKYVKLSNNSENILYSTIPSKNLKLTVVGLKSSTGEYKIYPSFEWCKEVAIANDVFCYELPKGWNLTPEKYNLRICNKINGQNGWQYVEDFDRPKDGSFYGYTWQMPCSYKKKALCRGISYFYATPTTSKPDKHLTIKYVHNKIRKFNLSVGFTYGPISITITPDDTNKIAKGYELLAF